MIRLDADNLKDLLLRARLHTEAESDYDWEQQKIMMEDNIKNGTERKNEGRANTNYTRSGRNGGCSTGRAR